MIEVLALHFLHILEQLPTPLIVEIDKDALNNHASEQQWSFSWIVVSCSQNVIKEVRRHYEHA